MKGVKRRSQLFDEFKSGPSAVLGVLYALRAVVPRTKGSAHPKGIRKAVAKSMPVNDGEAQMVSHRFALHHFVRVVMFEGERVPGTGTLKRDFGNAGESSWHKSSIIIWILN